MKVSIFYKAWVFLVSFGLMQTLYSQNLLEYVQPLSGTAPATTPAAIKHSEAGGTEKNANTIPAVGLPFGMTQWVAQTKTTETKCIPPYLYNDTLLSGFRGTHWISGSCMQDYGSFTVMPVVGKLKTRVKDYAVPFLHQNEQAGPASYKVDTRNFIAELTGTLRCGMMRFTMKQDDSLYLLIQPNSDYGKGFVQVDAGKGVVFGNNPVHRIYQGWGQPAGFSGWFYIRLQMKPAVSGTFEAGNVSPKMVIRNNKDIGAFVGWKLRKGESLVLSIGTSFSSMEGAARNLDTETGDLEFDDVQHAAEKAWEKTLATITVDKGSEKDKRIFYTAVYHAFQHPRLYNDADGTYPKFSGQGELLRMKNGNYYDDFSMWDIYRAQLPLITIVDTARTNDFVRSMILKGRQGNWLPIFPCWNSFTSAMIGDHVTAFIASAYNRGIRNYDVEEAYRLMRQNAFTVANEQDYLNGTGRRALPSYLQYNYIPMEDSVPIAFHKREQVSRTMEYAFDDYALSQVAKGLNKPEDYEALRLRSFNYRKVFDPSVKLVNGRHADGRWAENFRPDFRASYITEGTPRQYTFYVPHDVPGLAGLMGGERQLEKALDSLFKMGEYWHGNEPGHQIPFMYNFTSSPWKTQKTVSEILSEEYSDGPGGLSGNDDAGQMSAWYIFAAIGFYPLDPVSGNYQLTTPQFGNIRIQLDNERQFEIGCYKASSTSKYIEKVLWNGKRYDRNFITHAMIQQGGKLEFFLKDKPQSWGNKAASRAAGLN
jgi:predicted alpha-1,2-mannosidase